MHEQLERVVVVSEQAEDRLVKARAAKFAGSILVGKTLEVNDNQPFHSLYDALQAAAMGDEQAINLVRSNVGTDVIERTLKAGFVLSVKDQMIQSDGTVSQFGQSNRQVQANTLKWANEHPVMAKRNKAENNNSFRIENAARQGLLDDYSFVVFSRAEDDADLGFFTKTLSCSIQSTKNTAEGLETESAFVAGKTEDGVIHDEQVIVEMYKLLANIDITGLTPAEILDMPLLIHNSLMPNGVIDIVKIYDQLAGGKFFGLNQPPRDYLEYKLECQKQQDSYSDIIDSITEQLIASVDELKQPLDAVRKLNALSGAHSIERAVIDQRIDPRVFGEESARHINYARQAYMMGQSEVVNSEIKQAKHYDKSTSCPSVWKDNNGDDEGDSNILSGEDEFGSLTFYCQKGHRNTRDKGKLLPRCKVCNIDVSCGKKAA